MYLVAYHGSGFRDWAAYKNKKQTSASPDNNTWSLCLC